MTAIVFSSCSKDPLNNMSAEDSQVYITQRDSSVDFSNFHTFSIVDSVAVANNSGEGKELTSGDITLLKLIKKHMQDRGFELVDSTQNPDLGINVTRISYTFLNAVPYPYDYWSYPGYGGGGFWGYPGYDYYFPPSFGYYPPMFRYYNTQSDMMVIDIINLKDVGKDEKLEGVWNASLKGAGVLNPDYYPKEIKAIFEQSPYLKAQDDH